MLYYLIGRQMKNNHSHLRKINMINKLIGRSFLWLLLRQSSRGKISSWPLQLSSFSYTSTIRYILPSPQEKGHTHPEHWSQLSQLSHLAHCKPAKRSYTSGTLVTTVTTVTFGTLQACKKDMHIRNIGHNCHNCHIWHIASLQKGHAHPEHWSQLSQLSHLAHCKPTKRTCTSGTSVPTVPFGTLQACKKEGLLESSWINPGDSAGRRR